MSCCVELARRVVQARDGASCRTCGVITMLCYIPLRCAGMGVCYVSWCWAFHVHVLIYYRNVPCSMLTFTFHINCLADGLLGLLPVWLQTAQVVKCVGWPRRCKNWYCKLYRCVCVCWEGFVSSWLGYVGVLEPFNYMHVWTLRKFLTYVYPIVLPSCCVRL